MRTVLWQDPGEIGLERCEIAAGTLVGTALLTMDGGPCEVRYVVQVDGRWRTRHVEVERRGPDASTASCPGSPAPAGGPTGVRVVVDVVDGRWRVDGEHQADLDGCADVDLEFSPATNTLPIRRLDLPVGAGADIEVAWVRFPSLRVERAGQRYTRLGPDRYEFRMGDFVAELTVDDLGLVRAYADFWRQVAAS